MPRFGLGNFYRATPVTHAPLSGLGNVIRSIGQFYRQSSAFLPTAINPDLTTNCPAVAAGYASCPAAPPGSRTCPAKATGKACPVQTVSVRRTMPHFGLSGLRGYSGSYYVDTASGYSVEATGPGMATIFDSAGDTIYQSSSNASTFNQNYGPFSVDAVGNIYIGAVEIWDTENGLTGATPPATASAAPAVSTAPAPIAQIAAQSSGFFAAPVGYTATPATPAVSTSWFDKSTTLFGMTLKNSDLAAVLGIGGLFVVMSQRKRR
jgi:hypothetical protein